MQECWDKFSTDFYKELKEDGALKKQAEGLQDIQLIVRQAARIQAPYPNWSKWAGKEFFRKILNGPNEAVLTKQVQAWSRRLYSDPETVKPSRSELLEIGASKIIHQEKSTMKS